MGHSIGRAEKPLVALETDKLLGMRQAAKDLPAAAEGANEAKAVAAASRVEMSRMLSKVGTPET